MSAMSYALQPNNNLSTLMMMLNFSTVQLVSQLIGLRFEIVLLLEKTPCQSQLFS